MWTCYFSDKNETLNVTVTMTEHLHAGTYIDEIKKRFDVREYTAGAIKLEAQPLQIVQAALRLVDAIGDQHIECVGRRGALEVGEKLAALVKLVRGE